MRKCRYFCDCCNKEVKKEKHLTYIFLTYEIGRDDIEVRGYYCKDCKTKFDKDLSELAYKYNADEEIVFDGNSYN